MAKQEQEETPVVVAPVEEPVWDLPVSKEQIDAWKAEHHHVYAVGDLLDDQTVILRGMSRAEYKTLDFPDVKTKEEEDEAIAYKVLLWPELTKTQIREEQAAFATLVHNKFKELCHGNPEDNDNIEPLRLTSNLDDLDEFIAAPIKAAMEKGEITSKDLIAFHSMHGKLYVDIIDDQLFIYHGLRRKQYDQWRAGQREGKYTGTTAEDEICKSGVVFPLVKDFNVDDPKYLYGTISLLAMLIMKASGFNKQPVVTKL